MWIHQQFSLSSTLGAHGADELSQPERQNPMKKADSLPTLEVENDDSFSDPYNIPDDFWENAVLVEPNPKELISIRLDHFVLSYFREGGPGYQKRINQILHHYVLQKRLEEARQKGKREAQEEAEQNK